MIARAVPMLTLTLGLALVTFAAVMLEHAGCVQRASARIAHGSQLHPTPEQVTQRAERLCARVP